MHWFHKYVESFSFWICISYIRLNLLNKHWITNRMLYFHGVLSTRAWPASSVPSSLFGPETTLQPVANKLACRRSLLDFEQTGHFFWHLTHQKGKEMDLSWSSSRAQHRHTKLKSHVSWPPAQGGALALFAGEEEGTPSVRLTWMWPVLKQRLRCSRFLANHPFPAPIPRKGAVLQWAETRLRRQSLSAGWGNRGNTVPGPEPSGLDTPFDQNLGSHLKGSKKAAFSFKDADLCAAFFFFFILHIIEVKL